MSSELVTVRADRLLTLICLIGECIDDLSDEEQQALSDCTLLLTAQAPNTVASHQNQIEEIGKFWAVAAEGGLIGLFDPEDCAQFGCSEQETGES